MCVNYVKMVNVVSRQDCNDLIKSCEKCRALMTADKQVDFEELWRSRHAMPVVQNHGFKIWRKNNQNLLKNSKNQQDNDILKNNLDQEMNLLKFLAINALELTAPASPVLLNSRTTLTSSQNTQYSQNNQKNQWFQLSGHPDSLAPAGIGTVWKRQPDNSERIAYEKLSVDQDMRDVIPKYYREVQFNGETFIEMQDLLHGFQDPYVMDIKMGTRTFLESEVFIQKSSGRSDLYQKMISIDPNAPTAEEHHLKAVTKLRYMQFREEQSSSSSLGFRIEALKIRGKNPVKNLKTVKTQNQVENTLKNFLQNSNKCDLIKKRLLSRLKEIRMKFENSEFFKSHEIVGSSLFIIFDDYNVGVWLIDFAKTCHVPNDVNLNHRSRWVQGNHEEGFLFGLDKLIMIIEEMDFQETSFEKDDFLKTSNHIFVKS